MSLTRQAARLDRKQQSRADRTGPDEDRPEKGVDHFLTPADPSRTPHLRRASPKMQSVPAARRLRGGRTAALGDRVTPAGVSSRLFGECHASCSVVDSVPQNPCPLSLKPVCWPASHISTRSVRLSCGVKCQPGCVSHPSFVMSTRRFDLRDGDIGRRQSAKPGDTAWMTGMWQQEIVFWLGPPREKKTPPEGGVGGPALFCGVLVRGSLDHSPTSTAVTEQRQATQHNSS